MSASVNVVADQLKAQAQQCSLASDYAMSTLLYRAADEIERLVGEVQALQATPDERVERLQAWLATARDEIARLKRQRTHWPRRADVQAAIDMLERDGAGLIRDLRETLEFDAAGYRDDWPARVAEERTTP